MRVGWRVASTAEQMVASLVAWLVDLMAALTDAPRAAWSAAKWAGCLVDSKDMLKAGRLAEKMVGMWAG